MRQEKRGAFGDHLYYAPAHRQGPEYGHRIRDILEYVEAPAKTGQGRLITAYDQVLCLLLPESWSTTQNCRQVDATFVHSAL